MVLQSLILFCLSFRRQTQKSHKTQPSGYERIWKSHKDLAVRLQTTAKPHKIQLSSFKQRQILTRLSHPVTNNIKFSQDSAILLQTTSNSLKTQPSCYKTTSNSLMTQPSWYKQHQNLTRPSHPLTNNIKFSQDLVIRLQTASKSHKTEPSGYKEHQNFTRLSHLVTNNIKISQDLAIQLQTTSKSHKISHPVTNNIRISQDLGTQWYVYILQSFTVCNFKHNMFSLVFKMFKELDSRILQKVFFFIILSSTECTFLSPAELFPLLVFLQVSFYATGFVYFCIPAFQLND